MLEVANDKLTERERECLKHIRQARERGISFAEYCRSGGLKANEWHGVRHGMVKKGLLPPGPGAGPKTMPFTAQACQIYTGASGVLQRYGDPSIGMACRVRHPSGCIIECASWPELNWMRGLLGAQS